MIEDFFPQTSVYSLFRQNGAVRPLVIDAMAQWYQRGDGDQTRLSRILEVAHDLKALSILLTARPFPFVIDLACIASRREYLKLDKWLSDKIRDHGDPYITALVKFLQVKCISRPVFPNQ
jgi:CCR4-NOT transcription complex subunit 1